MIIDITRRIGDNKPPLSWHYPSITAIVELSVKYLLSKKDKLAVSVAKLVWTQPWRIQNPRDFYHQQWAIVELSVKYLLSKKDKLAVSVAKLVWTQPWRKQNPRDFYHQQWAILEMKGFIQPIAVCHVIQDLVWPVTCIPPEQSSFLVETSERLHYKGVMDSWHGKMETRSN